MKNLAFVAGALAIVLGIYEFAHRWNHNFFSLSAGKRPPGILAHPTPAPDFTLRDIDGNPLQLSSYRGKVVLLDFWATWCDPCRDEIPHFIAFQDKYRSQGLQVIGISMDDETKPIQEFNKQYKLNYPVALGTAQVAQSFGGILGIPITFLIGRDGQIAAKYIGQSDMSDMENEIRALLKNY